MRRVRQARWAGSVAPAGAAGRRASNGPPRSPPGRLPAAPFPCRLPRRRSRPAPGRRPAARRRRRSPGSAPARTPLAPRIAATMASLAARTVARGSKRSLSQGATDSQTGESANLSRAQPVEPSTQADRRSPSHAAPRRSAHFDPRPRRPAGDDPDRSARAHGHRCRPGHEEVAKEAQNAEPGQDDPHHHQRPHPLQPQRRDQRQLHLHRLLPLDLAPAGGPGRHQADTGRRSWARSNAPTAAPRSPSRAARSTPSAATRRPATPTARGSKTSAPGAPRPPASSPPRARSPSPNRPTPTRIRSRSGQRKPSGLDRTAAGDSSQKAAAGRPSPPPPRRQARRRARGARRPSRAGA